MQSDIIKLAVHFLERYSSHLGNAGCNDIDSETKALLTDVMVANALCCSEPVAMFTDRKQAAKAIRISVAHARLCEAQGKPVNTDFTDGRKYIRIVPLAKWGIV